MPLTCRNPMDHPTPPSRAGQDSPAFPVPAPHALSLTPMARSPRVFPDPMVPPVAVWDSPACPVRIPAPSVVLPSETPTPCLPGYHTYLLAHSAASLLLLKHYTPPSLLHALHPGNRAFDPLSHPRGWHLVSLRSLPLAPDLSPPQTQGSLQLGSHSSCWH